MNNISLLSWTKKELKRMTLGESLYLQNLVLLSSDPNMKNYNPRILERVMIYAAETNQTSRLMVLVCDKHKDEYETVLNILNGKKFSELSKDKKLLLPTRYQKALDCWRADARWRETLQEDKTQFLKRCLREQKEKNVPVSQICDDLDLDYRSIYTFFKHQDLSRVSNKNAIRMMKYLMIKC